VFRQLDLHSNVKFVSFLVREMFEVKNSSLERLIEALVWCRLRAIILLKGDKPVRTGSRRFARACPPTRSS
jgi:hypothetical protein